MNNLSFWQDYLRCPVDRQPLSPKSSASWGCEICGFETTSSTVKSVVIPDFRAQGIAQKITLEFSIPVAPLNRREVVEGFFHAPNQTFPHYSKREIRQQFGTKLDKGIQYYCQQVLREFGSEALILDLGCGSGGNRRYLHSLGFKNVLTVDWNAAGADLLVDAHRLPLADGMFHAVLSTAVFEHLYHPFQAMFEVSRVLRDGGYFMGSASFWEGWHGSSYFHFTPDGWNTLFSQAGLSLADLWPGWGIVPAALSHVLTPGYLRGFGYVLQTLVDGVYRLALGDKGLRRLYLRASGSYVVCARKPG